MHVERAGDSGPLVLLVHGSGAAGWDAWALQRPLAADYRLVVPHRTGYPPNPPLELIDFEIQARELIDLIEPGTNVVGHSYGGVVSLLAAALVPERVASLTVIEPPAFDLVRGDPDVERLVGELAEIWAARDASLRDRLARLGNAIGVTQVLPDPLPPEWEGDTRAMFSERPPWEAKIPLEVLARTSFRKLVVSGGHSAAFDAVCDVLIDRLHAERAVFVGRGHGVSTMAGPLNKRLRAFIGAG